MSNKKEIEKRREEVKTLVLEGLFVPVHLEPTGLKLFLDYVYLLPQLFNLRRLVSCR